MAETIRLNKVLRELNISIDKASTFLESKEIYIEKSPNTKISEVVSKLLYEEFENDANRRVASDKNFSTIAQAKQILREQLEGDIEEKILLGQTRKQVQVGKNDKTNQVFDSSGNRIIYLKDFLKGYNVSEEEAIAYLKNEDFEIDLSVPNITISVTQFTSLQNDFKSKRNNNKLDFEIKTSYEEIKGPRTINQKIDLSQFNKEKKKDEVKRQIAKVPNVELKKIWLNYIKAQSKILEHKSKPIGIDTTKSAELDGFQVQISIDQEIFKQVFKKDVENIFQIEDFDINNGYIQTSLEKTTNIEIDRLNSLKELAEICYIDFNVNPVIEGVISALNNDMQANLKNVIGELPTDNNFRNSGQIFLTINEWRQIQLINKIKFQNKVTARFNIKPSAKFISEITFQNQYFLHEYDDLATSEPLPQEVFEYLQKNINLKIKYVKVSIVADFEDNTQLLQNIREALKKKTKLFSYSSEIGLAILLEGRKLKKYGFISFDSAIVNIKEIINNDFGHSNLKISEIFVYSYDKASNNSYINSFLEKHKFKFEDKLKPFRENDLYRIDNTFDAIYFDFETEEELNQKLKFVKSFSFFDIYDRGEKHRYKFNIKFETGLKDLQLKLKRNFPDLNTKIILNGEKLIFRQFYKPGNKTEILARLQNRLDDLVEKKFFAYTINDTFYEKYLCEENFELKVEQEEEKLSKLLREDFYFGTPKVKLYLGKLRKVEYPDLYFTVEEDKLDEVKQNIVAKTVKAIFPDLKGERDKIKRLQDTVFMLDSKEKLPNDNAKEFLYDSSKAKTTDNIDYLLNKTSSEWQDFESNLFSKSLNESQRKAVFKSIYAEELALIQGPPGTGKSTAIAEIIWQHIRNEQKRKVLLTSETNLAVDNAIDRLKNRENNIVKPVRFGNTDNLESEGFFYSLEAIENWKMGNTSQNNTVSHWVDNISNRITSQEDVQIAYALDKWKIHLKNPNIETKKLFADKYLEYANLIGATGSSIGKLNSENKWTSFFHSYLNVFERAKYMQSVTDKTAKRYCYNVEINFDTIIMDEASKATPPELALPVVFGKKSIIVGDHRQLPPMIDGNEIKEVLISIGEKKLAETLSQKDFETSQFERLFLNIDDSIKGTFDTQYRMHPAINDAIAQFYKDDGGLNCGLPLEEIYHNSFDNWNSRYHGLKFKDILSPETHTIWINVNTPEIKEGTSRVNFGEIEAIDNILTILKNSQGKNEFDNWLSDKSMEEKQIGLISFYGKQIHYINKMLKENHNEVPIRLSTVDRFQGMERNIIIVSMVRSNKIASFQEQQPDEIHGELGYPLQDSLGFAESPNRLNVALSRARRLLIVVGNSEHFCRKDIYKNVFDTIQQNGKIISAEKLQKAVDTNGQY